MSVRRVSVSVVMACHDAAPFLDAAVQSVLQQTLEDIELLIVDDASRDGSLGIARRYLQDPRVVVLAMETNCGPAAARNRGFREARGEWVANLDADDLALPTRLERQLERARGDESLVLVGSGATLVDEQGQVLGRHSYPAGHARLADRLLRLGAFPCHSSILYRREAALRAGLFNSRFVPSEDYDLWLRLSEVGRLASLPEPLVQVRKHSRNISNREGGLRQVRLSRAALVCHFLREAGAEDPSHAADDAAWGAFLAWVDGRLKQEHVFDRHRAWHEARVRSQDRRGIGALGYAGAALLRSGHAGGVLYERFLGSPVPRRLAAEWAARQRERRTAT